MWLNVAEGILIPFLGTALGAACVFFLRGEMNPRLKKALGGFAAGIMTSASFFSLLLPSMEQSSSMGKFAFVPAVIGFLCGMLFLLALDLLVPGPAQAITMSQKFQADPAGLYHAIVGLLSPSEPGKQEEAP